MELEDHHQDDHKELQLLPAPTTEESQPSIISKSKSDRPIIQYNHRSSSRLGLVDLQLSISVRPLDDVDDDVAALKWEAAEQIRAAAMERAYAERVRELTRREMELAQEEFTRARHVWERAREEAERAERLKDRATVASPACVEITCQSCRQRFRPN